MLIFAFLFTAPANASERVETVRRKISEDDFQGARKRCERWEAWSAIEDQPLREACAEAFWPLTEVDDSATAWRDYRQRWAGTASSVDAFERLAAATLRELPETSSEDAFLKVAADFPKTRAEALARDLAADAAVRDVTTPEAALAVARRYPDHPGLLPLVEKYPAQFVRVELAQGRAKFHVDPPLTFPDFMQPRVEWVARWPGGQTRAWKDVAAEQLSQSGLTEVQIRAAAAGQPTGAPSLPLCALPGQPEGWHVAAEVHVGAGTFFQPVAWSEGCGPEALPVVFTVAAGQVTGFSLQPGHQVDLASRSYQERPNTRAYAPAVQGAPQLSSGQLYLPAGRVWVVYPMNGGPPWMTDRAPPQSAQTILSPQLRGTRPPTGWRLSRQQNAMVLINPSVPGSRWEMPLGEVRFLSPLMQRVLGVEPASLRAQPQGAAAVTAGAGWVKNKRGDLRSKPPEGAVPIEVEGLSDEQVHNAQMRVVSAGLELKSLEVLDGWAMDLDNDGERETVLRVRSEKRGLLLVLDVHPELGNRLFAFGTNNVATISGAAEAPFGFQLGGAPYLAWVGVASPNENFVETLRYDGISFRLDPIVMSR